MKIVINQMKILLSFVVCFLLNETYVVGQSMPMLTTVDSSIRPFLKSSQLFAGNSMKSLG